MIDPNVGNGEAGPEQARTGERPLFHAVIYPNPPLSRLGFALVMGVVATISFAVSLGFYLIGAWPVAGFFGLDVLLLFLAFRVVRHRARAYESVRIDREQLTICRMDFRGRAREWHMHTHFARVELERPVRHNSLIYIRDRAESVRLGAFLTPSERGDFVEALGLALHSSRRTVYG